MTVNKILFVRLKALEADDRRSRCQQDVSIIGDISRHRQELESLQKQTKVECEALRLLRVEYDSAQSDMELLLEACDKHRRVLDSLDSQLDSEITARRSDVEVRWLMIDCVYNSK